jgi:hypothetical protein
MAGARVREFKGMHVREHADAEAMAAGQDGGDAAVSTNRQGGSTAKGKRVRRRRQRHLHKTASQPGSKAGITQRDGAAVTRQDVLG